MTAMIELGERLKEARESRGMSLEDVSLQIKISVRTLKALEAGDKEELPHVVYAKGFVKSYALALKLDPEELGNVVDEAYADEIEEAEQEMLIPSVTVRDKRVSALPAIILILALLAAAGSALWFLGNGKAYFDSFFSSAPEVSVTEEAPAEAEQPALPVTPDSDVEILDESEAAVSPAVAPAVTEESAVGGMEAEEAQPDELAGPDSAGSSSSGSIVEPPNAASTENAPAVSVPQAKPVAPAEPVAEPLSTPQSTSASPVVPPAAESQEQRSDMQVVGLTAHGDCWVEAWGEGFERKELFLREGQRFFFSFPNELHVKLGNSGAVTVTLNGSDHAFDSGEGKVRTLLFPAR